MSGFAELSASDRMEYESTLKRFGLTVDNLNYKGTLSTQDFGDKLVLSADPSISAIEPTIVPYNSLAELKAMIGRADSDYTDGPFSDRLLDYPAPLDRDRVHALMATRNECDFDYQVTRDELHALYRAAQAYIMGNSQKLKTHEPILNKRFGTGSVAVLAVEALVVKAGHPVIFAPDPNDPNKILCPNFTSVTVENGGQIIVSTKIQMTTTTFTAAD
ncbi:hypothetical protein [Paracoccus lutimaris]|uniref:Uncharacterized protein n=1 Tax=Paracoccus lutimaris TaxID=1490030 RepID=A0A368YWS5_9RHOB|nr:hypothetical protein [Paracoccus lutimaris]RCW84099.1 hypothetical protein DFP89_10843 [Paracoccus lutimaris]